MSQHDNPKGSDSRSSRGRRRTKFQETLLLSDVPEAAALMPDASTASPILTTAHLGTQAVNALSERYDILAEAGFGSMGNVYKARDRETGEIIALKLLKPEIASDQAMMDRFKNELLFARKITHKNVCRLHEFNRIGGIAYTSMEFVEGESLRSVLNRFGGLPTRKAIDLVLQICSGLKEAHAQGIVHRDLKPENVMIDAQGNVKIMDFGIARSMEAGTRLTGSMVGTPAYMAPEQVAGKPVDYRTDLYSLGLMMYEVFTGTQAFQADNAVAVALKQMREIPKAPHEIEPNVPASIERVILKCLEKEPPRRFQSIVELENALRSPGAQATPTPANLANIPFNRPSHPTPIPQPLHSAPPSKGTSPVAWIVLFSVLGLTILGGLHAAQIAQFADSLKPPAGASAPIPPDFAAETSSELLASAAQSASAAQPVGAQPADLDIGAANSDDAKPAERAPIPMPTPTPAPKTNLKAAPPARAPTVVRNAATVPESAQESVPANNAPTQVASASPSPATADAQKDQGGDKALSEPQAGGATAPATSPGQSYIWIARYEVEERAQAAARKIESLGLPAMVVPRHNEKGDFWVVLTGPFGAKRVPSVIDWLETQGFPNVRQVGGFISSLKSNQNQ
jgi:serine/threonine protein kinase